MDIAPLMLLFDWFGSSSKTEDAPPNLHRKRPRPQPRPLLQVGDVVKFSHNYRIYYGVITKIERHHITVSKLWDRKYHPKAELFKLDSRRTGMQFVRKIT